MSTASPALAPRYFSETTSGGVPLRALLGTASISALCFASSFVGSGELWGWLQNIVGVSNQVRLLHWAYPEQSPSHAVVLESQIAWLSIGIASWRFRKAWIKQGRPLSEMKFRAGWTWTWGAPFVVISVSVLILCAYCFHSSALPNPDTHTKLLPSSPRMDIILSLVLLYRLLVAVSRTSRDGDYDFHLVFYSTQGRVHPRALPHSLRRWHEQLRRTSDPSARSNFEVHQQGSGRREHS